MGFSPTLLAGIAALASLAGLGSYYIYQWRESYVGRSPLPWFVSGLAFTLVLLGLALALFQSLPDLRIAEPVTDISIGSSGRASSVRADARLRDSAGGSHAHVTHADRLQRDIDPRARSENIPTSREREDSRSTEVRTEAGSSVQVSGSGTLVREPWLEDLSFWGATRCVLALRLDPEDLETWILINECAVDVRILVATCASPLEECLQRRAASWSYVRDGVFLPAKATRSVALDEQTVHGRHLRYVACRLAAADGSRRVDDPPASLRHVGVQSCDEEVRSLSLIGARSGEQIEELVNEPVPANTCCVRSE